VSSPSRSTDPVNPGLCLPGAGWVDILAGEMVKKWIFPPERPDEVRRLTSALNVSALTARVLVNRGIREAQAAQSFLQPSLHDLQDPCEDPAVQEAARFLLDTARAGRRITVFGDYDADGICAAALLMRVLTFLDARADTYIPHRIEEGYGLSCDALRELKKAGTEVVVTVDCGVSANREIALARELGMEVLVTDHHEPGDERPQARHLLNPKLDDCRFGYRFLAGVGVAFKLVWALGQQLSGGSRVSDEFKDLLVEAMALVAIGTVADVVPLLDENRVLVRYGLKSIRATGRPGMAALLEAGRVRAEVSATDVAFRLAPLLNAAGRMGHAKAAVELLTTHDAARAATLARELVSQNQRRRSVQRATCREAEELVAQDEHLQERNCIVLVNADWHQGIVGLVASRLAEKFWRPAFVFTTDGDVARGSARSIGGFPLYTAVEKCADLLEEYGGHEGAAGLAVSLANMAAFQERIDAVAGELRGAEVPTPELGLDGHVALPELNVDLLREIQLLAPFGRENPEPVFAASGLQLAGNPQTVGADGQHLAFMVRQDRTTLRVIAMRKADWLEPLRDRKGEPFSLAFQPGIDTYRGPATVELRATDLQWDAEQLQERLSA